MAGIVRPYLRRSNQVSLARINKRVKKLREELGEQPMLDLKLQFNFRPYPDFVQKMDDRGRFTWSFKQLEDGGYRIRTPNRKIIFIGKDPVWDFQPDEQYQSTLLWAYSLRYLQYIAADKNDFSFINSVVPKFRDFLLSPRGREIFDGLTSRDHLAAEVIGALTYLGSSPQFKAVDAAEEILNTLISWALNGNIQPNNHGMMLCGSIMQASRHIDEPGARDLLIRHTEQRLTALLSSVIDETGFCVENSPSYHAFYIRYLDDLQLDLSDPQVNSSPEFLSSLRRVVSAMRESLEQIALPNGQLPPLGDGNLQPGNIDKLVSGELYSQASGFYCVKDENVYFSVKSGAASGTHKHMDDTSIFLWARGESLLLDAGLLNYDNQDAVANSIKSQVGHSGAFYRRFDDLMPSVAYRTARDSKWRVSAQLLRLNDDGVAATTLKAVAEIDEQFGVSRTVTVHSLEQYRIADSFTNVNESRVIRFNIPSEYEVDRKPGIGTIEVRALRSTMTIELRDLDTGELLTEGISIFEGANTDEGIKGWRAVSFNKSVACKCLEIDVPVGSRGVETVLRLQASD